MPEKKNIHKHKPNEAFLGQHLIFLPYGHIFKTGTKKGHHMQGRELGETKAVTSEGRLCFDCAYPVMDKNVAVCPRCHSQDLDDRRSRPKKTEPRFAPTLPFPWHTMRFELGGTGLISGGPGSGKTTSTMKMVPTRFLTSEQHPEKVGQLFYRLYPNGTPPLISSVSSWEHLADDLIGLNEDDLVIVDSISQLSAPHMSGRIVGECIQMVQQSSARCWVIAQFTKDGSMLGPNELNHLVDAVAKIPADNLGMRRLILEKNRFGKLTSTYFAIGDSGIIEPHFTYAYSVEGPAGNYRLNMYPMKRGAAFAGIFSSLEEAGVGPLEGFASAAIPSGIYRTGFAEPDDANMRRQFAEAHGLEWLTPQTAIEWIADPETAQQHLVERSARMFAA